MQKPTNLILIILLIILATGLSLFSIHPGAAETNTITIGPWTFEDNAFADVVSDASGLNDYDVSGEILNAQGTPVPAITLDDALLGYSPTSYLQNIGGSGGQSNLFELQFVNLLAENRIGPDMVFFDCHFEPEADTYGIAIRPQGGDFSDFLIYEPDDFAATTVGCDPETPEAVLWGAEVNIGSFNFPIGVIVDAIRFTAINGLKGPDGDPVMAAVYSSSVPPSIMFLPIVQR